MTREVPNPDNPDWVALEFVKWCGVIPLSIEKPPSKNNPASPPSNSEMRRWLDQGSVLINGKTPKANETIDMPVWQFVFFHKSARKRTTVI
jgi:hypothetical protein